MNEQHIRVCIDKEIPQHRSGKELALIVPKKWENGAKVRVHFLNGESKVKNMVLEIALIWQDYANISLDFVEDLNAEIRVAFLNDNTSWSAVGRDALNVDWFPKGQPTMNFGWLTHDSTEEDCLRVVLHEFGHALGCIHEHQSPDNDIPWNREAVYNYYGARGWTRPVVDYNIFRKYSLGQTQFSEFDESSIMLYPIPKALTDGRYEVGWNSRLSSTDKSFIAKAYPKM